MSELRFRDAAREDVPVIVAMLVADALGKAREQLADPLPQPYYDAWTRIDDDPNNRLIVAVEGDAVVGVLQVTFIPGLTYRGGTRALIEAVRVRADRRSAGIGRRLIEHVVDLARAGNCVLVQLTTDKTRADAQRFYESLGFRASHEGMKRFL